MIVLAVLVLSAIAALIATSMFVVYLDARWATEDATEDATEKEVVVVVRSGGLTELVQPD